MPQPLGEERRVVPFAAPAGRVRRRLVVEPGRQAAVLLFTGVRYDRAGGNEPASPPAREPPPAPDPRRGN